MNRFRKAVDLARSQQAHGLELRAATSYAQLLRGRRDPGAPLRPAPVVILPADVYSLIESAKLCGVEPRAVLRKATLRAVRSPGTATLARDLKSPRS